MQEIEDPSSITTQQIDALLPFLDRFEAVGFSIGKWEMPEGQFPYFNFESVVMEFSSALYHNGWISKTFDWTTWQNSAEEFVDSPEQIESADATTIQKLFTTHSRRERFCEGHLAAMFKNGHIVALLHRLKEIRKTMKD